MFHPYTIGDFVEAGIAHIQTGPFGTQLKAFEYVPDGVPVINVRNIGYSDLRADKLEFVTEAKADQLDVHRIEADDIVFGRKGAVDRHLFVKPEHKGWVQGSDCIRLRIASDDINPRYLSYAMLSEQHKKWMLNQCGNKATMASLNQDVVKRIALRMPQRSVQNVIVDTLSAYDDLIENNRQRIALLEEGARQLYKEWFVRFRFPGHEHVKIIDGMPKGWERLPLGDVLTLQRGFDLPVSDRNEGAAPVYGSTGIVGFHDVAKVDAPMLITGRSGSLGQVRFVSIPCWPLNTALWVREFKRASAWFAYFLLSEMGLEKFNGGASVPTLDRKVAHAAPVLLPSVRLLETFDGTAQHIFELIDNLARQNKQIAIARDLLLPKLMSGAIAV